MHSFISRGNPRGCNSLPEEEVDSGRLIGPLPRDLELISGVHISPVGVVSKSNYLGKWWPILIFLAHEAIVSTMGYQKNSPHYHMSVSMV